MKVGARVRNTREPQKLPMCAVSRIESGKRASELFRSAAATHLAHVVRKLDAHAVRVRVAQRDERRFVCAGRQLGKRHAQRPKIARMPATNTSGP